MAPFSNVETNSPAKKVAPKKSFFPSVFGRKSTKEVAENKPAPAKTEAANTEAVAKYEPGFQYVKLEFEVLADKLDAFCEALRSPLGIPFTVQQPGFKMFLPAVHKEKNEAGNHTVTFFSMWESCDAWKAYMATPERAPGSAFMEGALPLLGPKGMTPTFTSALDLGPHAHKLHQEAGEQFEYVKLEFEVLADKLAAFQEGLKGPLGIPFTIEQPGFKGFFPAVHEEKNAAGNFTVTFFGMWRTHADQQAYMATPERAPDSATMQALFPCLGPKGLDVIYATPLDLGQKHGLLN